MNVLLQRLVLIAGPVLCGAAVAQSSVAGIDRGAERERLSKERQVIEQTFAAQEKACYQQFVVSSCVSEAKAKRRDALADIQRQEAVLNNADRLERGAQAQQRIDEAQSPAQAAERERQRLQRVDQAAANREQADKQAERRFDNAARSGDSRDAAAAKAAQAQSSLNRQAAKEAVAADKRAAYDKKLADAQRRQAEADKKRADQSKPRAAPLPPGGSTPAKTL